MFINPGFVYVLRDERQRVYKIGFSSSVKHRKRRLEQTYGDLKLVCFAWSANAPFLERSMHSQFRRQRVRRTGDGGTEWFVISWWQVPWLVVSLFAKAIAVNIVFAALGIVATLLVFEATRSTHFFTPPPHYPAQELFHTFPKKD